MLKNIMNKKRKSKGFTLIELIIVIAIIAILAAVAIPKYLEVRENGNVKADIANAKNMLNAVGALVSDDKLNLPTTGNPVYFLADDSDNTTSIVPGSESGGAATGDATGDASGDAATGDTAGKILMDYLQADKFECKAKETKGKKFVIGLGSDGTITVYASSNVTISGDSSDAIKILPGGAAPYND